MRRTRETRTEVGVAGALLGALLFSACATIGADLLISAVRLQRNGVETTAEVVETGRGGRRGNWVRYRFSVGDDPRVYSANDALRLRRDVSVYVAPHEWEQARRNGTIRVRYLPSNPQISLPADAPPFLENPWLSGVCTAFTGLLALVGWVTFIDALRRRRDAASSVPPAAG